MKTVSALVLSLFATLALAQEKQTDSIDIFPYSTELSIPMARSDFINNASFLEDKLSIDFFGQSKPTYLFYQDLLDFYDLHVYGLVRPLIEPNLFPHNDNLRFQWKRVDLGEVRGGLYYNWDADFFNKIQREQVEYINYWNEIYKELESESDTL